MSTTTTRLALVKPITSEDVDVTILNANSDKIDTVAGMVYASSSTRPSTPFQGQPVYESDTGNTLVHNGSSPASGGWEYITVPVVAATSSFSSPNSGQLLMLSTENMLYRYTGSAWAPYVPGVERAVKTTDLSVTSNATLASDAQLTVPVAANATYQLDMFLDYSSATAADAQVSLSVPASATWKIAPYAMTSATAATSGSLETAPAASGGVTLGGDGVGTHVSAVPCGWVKTAGTAGNVVVQWAQLVSTASATVLYTGSWIRLTRVS
jgi:hypothetical protein